MFIKIPNGEFYYFRKEGNCEIIVRKVFSGKLGILHMQNATVPKELIGKKVRIKLEVVK